MANEENLHPVQSKNEARERGRAGGIASGKSRRRKRAMRQLAQAMLAAPVDDATAATLADQYGITGDDADYQAAVIAALIKKAIGGNVNAIQLLAQLTGDDLFLQVRQAEVRIKRAELKEKQRQYDLDRQDRQEQDTADSDLAAAWLDSVIATGEAAEPETDSDADSE